MNGRTEMAFAAEVPQTMSRKSVQCIVAVAVIGVAWLAPTAVEAQTGPDLVVESPSVTDSTPTSGTTFTLSATVRNAGDGASAATTLRFYRSTDSTITTSDRVQGINAETVTGLAASESSSSHSLDILAPPAPVQFYYGACVTAVADESDTTNNCSGSVLVRVQARTTVTIASDHETFTAVLDLATFTLTRTGDPAEALDVSVALTQDKDLIGSGHLAQTVTFRADEATATLNIPAFFFAGNTVTGETALTATVQDGSGYVPGSPNTASTRIRVADPAVTASFEQAAYTFDEAVGDATIAVILRTATGVPVPHGDIFLSINSDTITGGASPGGVDFEKPAGSIQFVPSDFTADGTHFTARKEVTLAIVDDALDEPDEALTVILEPLPSTPSVVALSRPDGTACPIVRRCDATVTITDNDESAVATLSALAVNDGSTGLTLDPTFTLDTYAYAVSVETLVDTVTLSATATDATGASVAYLDSDGNAIDDADTTEDGFQVALAVGANAITVRVTAENGTTTQDYTVTVTRAEALPTVTVAAAIYPGETVAEGADAAFTLSRTGSTTAVLTVTVTVSQTGAVLKDASAVPSSVTFAADAVTATLALATADDDTDDDAGTVTVTLGTGTGYTVGDPGAATVAVSDNDVPVDFVLAVPATVAEDAGTVTVTVTATTAENAPPATLVEVQLARVGGTATGGSDYEAVSETVRFQVSAFAAATVDGQPRYQSVWTHDVVIHDDEEVEGDETLVLEMSPTSAFLLIHTLHGAHDAVQATLTIVDDDAANAAPSFTSSGTFDAAENQTTAGTVMASDDDTGDDITGYEITVGADAGFFSIGPTTGVLTFDAVPNFEDPQDADTDNAYLVTVQATSGTGEREKTATQTITVTVRDDDTEAPAAPDAPSVSSVSVTSLSVTWTAPDNAGPEVTDYDYRYRTTLPPGAWAEVINTTITASSATITGLAENTEYDVQVRATNDEGTGAWSGSGSGATDANAAPSFTSSGTFDAAENQTTVGTVRAEDDDAGDDITGYEITVGADAGFFSIGPTTGVLTFDAVPNFEDPQDADTGNTYLVTVQATSGTGDREKTATETITVTVRDDDTEAPAAPDAPSVSSESVTSLSVTWTAPDNAGPEITDYDYRHRTTSPQGAWMAVTNTTITALSATITGLEENTSYDVQVRATNAEGTGGWSDSGSDATDANAAPSFTSSETFDAAENQTTVGTVRAEDDDAGDDITGYAISGGADQALFSINDSGVLTFQAAPNFEDAQESWRAPSAPVPSCSSGCRTATGSLCTGSGSSRSRVRATVYGTRRSTGPWSS